MRIFVCAALLFGCSSSHKSNVDGGSPDLTSTPSVDSGSGDAAQTIVDASSDAAASDASTGPTEMVHFVGRFDTSGSKPQFDWSASAIATRFTGTGISVALADGGDNFFIAVIDGMAMTPFQTSKAGTYTLATTLTAGTHDLLLYKQTEGFFSTVSFGGFTVSGGAIVAKSYTPTRRIEIIGDSISCGYGDTGMGPNCSFSNTTEQEYLAYGSDTARALNAEQTTIAWSGKGMYINNDKSLTDTMPTLYQNTIAVDDKSTYAFKDAAPDAIVINLGTNDFANGDPGMTNFVGAYEAFIAMLRTHYPNAWIFVTMGPLLGDPNATTCRGYLQKVVSDRNTTNKDSKVTYVEFPTQDVSKGVGCDYHPTVAEHQIMANILVPAIKSKLGW